LSSRGMLTL